MILFRNRSKIMYLLEVKRDTWCWFVRWFAIHRICYLKIRNIFLSEDSKKYPKCQGMEGLREGSNTWVKHGQWQNYSNTYCQTRIGIANSHWDTCSVSKKLDIQTSYSCIAHPGPSPTQPNRHHQSSTCESNNLHIHLRHVISNFESYQPSRLFKIPSTEDNNNKYCVIQDLWVWN